MVVEVSHHPTNFSGHWHYGGGDNDFSLSRDLKGLLDQSAMWLLSNHFATFGGHKHSGSKNVFLVCHMILRDYIIKESCDFMGWSHSRSWTAKTLVN